MSSSHTPTSTRGFGATLEPGARPALLVIDFVKAYLLPQSPLYANVEPVRRACVQLLKVCRDAGIPIFHTNVAYEAGGRDGGVFFRKVPGLQCFEQGASPELAEFGSEVEPRSGEVVITKQYASAFFGTPLASLLTSSGIDTVLIAGLSTSGCVRASAVDCCQYGFVPLVVREAVGDRTAGPHEANLFDLQMKYAEVVTLDFVRSYLSKLGHQKLGE